MYQELVFGEAIYKRGKNINDELEDIDFRRFWYNYNWYLYEWIELASFISQETIFKIVSTTIWTMQTLVI